MTTTDTYDAVVVGGGAAGLSGALTLARARRSVLVLDAGAPRNAPAAGVHGFLTRDGTPPLELLAQGRAEVEGYGGTIRATGVAAAEPDGDGFLVTTRDGDTVSARRLLLATGLTDELPDIPGLRERWGHSVLHCPYCHGWEVRDGAIGVVGTSAHAFHQAQLFRQWSADIVLFLHTAPEPDAETADGLRARGIRVVRGEVAAIEEDGVRLGDGELVARDAIVVMPRFVARTDGLEGLGLRIAEHEFGVGAHVETDELGRTSVPGVWAAGNVTDLVAAVSGAVDGGVRSAAQLNADLIGEDVRRATAPEPVRR